jgi:hypothetical protein
MARSPVRARLAVSLGIMAVGSENIWFGPLPRAGAANLADSPGQVPINLPATIDVALEIHQFRQIF